jgi:hypothetical protein
VFEAWRKFRQKPYPGLGNETLADDINEFLDHWTPVNGRFPQSLTITILFERDCWGDWWRYSEFKEGRTIGLGPLEFSLEL